MANKKIGILTFHRATNYGAILQAYGLVSYLNSQGYDAKIIDYKPQGMANAYSFFQLQSLTPKRILVFFYVNLMRLLDFPQKCKKRNMFWNYIEKILPMTEKVMDEHDLPTLDAIFVGSDQVWSTCFTCGLDKFYYGQFDRKGAKLISYAGSAAEDMENSFYSTNNALLLESFDAISVREDELQEYLQEQLPNKEIVKVLDPTLLAGADYFENLTEGVQPYNKPYILIYQVIRKQDSLIQEYAKQKAKELNCDIIEIKDSKMFVDRGDGYVENGMVDPTLFVALFKHTSHIITTSFHGTVFSLMFNRPFDVVSVSPEVDSRAKDLLHQVGLDARMVFLPSKVADQNIDWAMVNDMIIDIQRPSRAFITNSLRKL